MNKISLIITVMILIKAYIAEDESLLQKRICPENKVEFKGACFEQIPYCQYYISGTQCIKCDVNYTLINYMCEKTELISDNFLFSLQLQKYQKSKISSRQTIPTINDISNFNKIKKVVLKKRQNMTSPQNQPIIKNFLKTPLQSYFGFFWMNKQNINYLFQYKIDQNGQVSELIADVCDSNLQNSWFGKINDKIIEKADSKIDSAALTKIVPISKNLYKFHYYNQKGFHYVAFIQKIPFLEIRPIEQVAWKYDQTEILNFLYSQHPILATESILEIKKRENTKNLQYSVKFKSGSKVILQEFPMQKQRIIFFSLQYNKTVPLNSKSLGSYQTFRNKQDQIIRKMLDNLYSQFQFLKNSQITKIQYQIVSGTNFLIYLMDNNGNDQYMCKVFYSLTSEINILEIYMNSVLIHTQTLSPLQSDFTYNYKEDEDFNQMNLLLMKSKAVKLPKQISYVNKVKKIDQKNTFYQFQIVYDQKSFVTINFFIDGPRKGQIRFLDMVNRGNSELSNLKDVRRITKYLQGSKKWLNPLIITYLKQTKPKEFLLKAITGQGSYFFKLIDDENSGFNILYYELIDEKQYCITHSFEQEYQLHFLQMSFMKKLVDMNKIDPESEIVSFSEGVSNSRQLYRFLFFNPQNHRKTQVLASMKFNHLQIIKIQQQNNGFGIINDPELYQKVIQKAYHQFYQDLQSSKPIFGLMNPSIIQLYMAKSTYSKQNVYLVEMNLLLQNLTIKPFISQQKSQTCIHINKENQCIDCQASCQSLMSQCYEKIKGCFKQIGNICVMCENQYSLVENQCINHCSFFI